MKRVFLFCVSGLMITLLVRGGMNATGFCWAEKRWLSDQEFTLNAIEYESKLKQMAAVDDAHPALSYLQSNPQCCVLTKKNWHPLSFLGFGYANVEVQYKLSTNAHKQDVSDEYGSGHYTLNACGKQIAWFGETKQKKYTRFVTQSDGE